MKIPVVLLKHGINSNEMLMMRDNWPYKNVTIGDIEIESIDNQTFHFDIIGSKGDERIVPLGRLFADHINIDLEDAEKTKNNINQYFMDHKHVKKIYISYDNINWFSYF
jgi:hypothetical protein